MRHKRFHEGRTSAKPYGRFSSFCKKHNKAFPTYDFCLDCERERYQAQQDQPAPVAPEPTEAEKERRARIQALADAMAGGPSNG